MALPWYFDNNLLYFSEKRNVIAFYVKVSVHAFQRVAGVDGVHGFDVFKDRGGFVWQLKRIWI